MKRFIKNRRLALRTLIGRNPILFKLVYLRKIHQSRIVRKDFDLCIEGFPRSANSFYFNRFLDSYPEFTKIAHHLHMPQQILLSKQWDIPIILLLRNPFDAVSSWLVAEPLYSPNLVLANYISFHRSIQDIASSICIVTFEEATQQFPKTVERFNSKYRCSLARPHLGEGQESRIFDRLANHNKKIGQHSDYTAIPNSVRRRKKEAFKSEIYNCAEFQIANEIFHSFCEAKGT